MTVMATLGGRVVAPLGRGVRATLSITPSAGGAVQAVVDGTACVLTGTDLLRAADDGTITCQVVPGRYRLRLETGGGVTQAEAALTGGQAYNLAGLLGLDGAAGVQTRSIRAATARHVSTAWLETVGPAPLEAITQWAANPQVDAVVLPVWRTPVSDGGGHWVVSPADTTMRETISATPLDELVAAGVPGGSLASLVDALDVLDAAGKTAIVECMPTTADVEAASWELYDLDLAAVLAVRYGADVGAHVRVLTRPDLNASRARMAARVPAIPRLVAPFDGGGLTSDQITSAAHANAIAINVSTAREDQYAAVAAAGADLWGISTYASDIADARSRAAAAGLKIRGWLVRRPEALGTITAETDN